MNKKITAKKIVVRFAAIFMAAIMLLAAAPPPLAAYASNHGLSGARVLSAKIMSDDIFTSLTFTVSERVRFTFSYTRNTINIGTHNAFSVPNTVNIEQNPLFSSGRWNNGTLTLNLVTEHGFIGYHGFYSTDEDYVIRFRNPPSSIAVARIVIDPGHGGRDLGAQGFRRDMPEAVINRQMAQLLSDELIKRGATVLVLDTARGMEASERIRRAEEFNADILISIHNNASGRNPAAQGTEVFFTTLYSGALAAAISENISGSLNTVNRGAKRANYPITRSTRFVSVMAEAGFVTNEEEYKKLIDPYYQSEIAQGIASAVSDVIDQIYPGTGRTMEN